MGTCKRGTCDSLQSRFLTLTAAGTVVTLLVLLEMDWYLDVKFQGTSYTGISLAVRQLPNSNDDRTTPTSWGLSSFPLSCGWAADTLSQTYRMATTLQCAGKASIVLRRVDSDITPSLMPLNDTNCLKKVIQEHCRQPKFRIPEVVHYIRFGNTNMTLMNFVSVVSVARFIQPCLVVIHSDALPTGPYWNTLLHLIPNIVHVHQKQPRTIHGHVITELNSRIDVARLRILNEYGGIYVDNDQFILQPLHDFYNHSTVIEQKDFNCSRGFLLSESGAPFLRHWLASYTDLGMKSKKLAENSIPGANSFILDNPNLVHVVKSFHTTDSLQLRTVLRRTNRRPKDWQKQYGFHMCQHRESGKFFRDQKLDDHDSLLGRVIRYVLYGHEKNCATA